MANCESVGCFLRLWVGTLERKNEIIDPVLINKIRQKAQDI